MQLHWDGNNDSVDERNLSAALGAGVTPVTVDHAGLKRVRDWIWTLPPPTYPYPVDAGAGRARRGRLPAALRSTATPTTGSATASSRGDARRPGRADRPHRHRSAPARLLHADVRARTSTRSIPTRRTASRTSARRTATPTSRWTASGCARPYLHNGSVPTLRDLLEPAGAAPEALLPRLRRLRSGGWVRLERAASRRAGASPATTRRCPATATAATCTARSCRTPTSARSSST